MFDDIVQDWERWVASPRARRKLEDWGRRHPATAGWEVAQLRTPTSSQRTDTLQAALVALAQGGDEDATRTLIVQLRPGLVGLVWRAGSDGRWHQGGSRREVEWEVLSAFGETLSSHRLDRRPARIAANLLLDTRQRLWRAAQRERRLVVATSGVNEPQPAQDQSEAIDGALDLVAAIESALEGLAAAPAGRRLTAELAYRAWILDEPSVAIARELGLRRKTVDTRLCRLRSVLRTTRAPDEAQRATRRSDGSAPPSSPVGPSCVSRQ